MIVQVCVCEHILSTEVNVRLKKLVLKVLELTITFFLTN